MMIKGKIYIRVYTLDTYFCFREWQSF